jgi:hypothetical protein
MEVLMTLTSGRDRMTAAKTAENIIVFKEPIIRRKKCPDSTAQFPAEIS